MMRLLLLFIVLMQNYSSVYAIDSDYRQRAEELFDLVWNKYRIPKYKLFSEYYPNDHRPDLNYFQETNRKTQETSYLWPMSGIFSSVNLLMVLDSTKYTRFQDSMIIAVEKYYDDMRFPAAYQAYPVQFEKVDRYYDDNALVGIDYVDAYRVSQNSYYLHKAENIMAFIMSGWRPDYGGGVSWLEGHLDQKPACSNGMATVLALKLYETTNKVSYLNQGKRFYDWIINHLEDDSLHIIWNALLTQKGDIQKHAYTYNTGTMIQSAVRLYRITGNMSYLEDAKRLAEGSFKYYVKYIDKRPYINDLPWFIVVLFRGYQELYEIDKNARYVNTLIQIADWAWIHARDSKGLMYKDWTGKKNENATPKWLLDEACMIELYARIEMIKNNFKGY